ncbi:amidase signature enzyme [Conidiobolus coronatus NRRL 28638]|uniref:amidase n=1 Tax=Conidiobolus coronatus (strain ATCC 28846 / CBS 209.66 / NRRL 28638) TaxID=796925 RepID=A0A137NYG0_CONC2|nr:amidase signature enzyme [Conidiobolus coronatus NRRL 28638]|eukprot:KXN67639.1 amidase signature enzyme [Conidiobolus coronatus NRRL 28638]
MKLDLDLITNYSASQIADTIRDGDVKAIDVLKAMRISAEKSSKYNAVVQFLDDYSTEKAEKIDEQIAQGVKFSKEEYPLLGVPISVKDCYGIKGYENTIGLDRFKGVINEKTNPLIEALEKSGAIPFCTTHVSQFMGTIGSTNSHGITYNPYSEKYTAGGSSSGEGALIGSDGSILGIGGDIGGSIRIPASFCGIYGLKPTPRRLFGVGERIITPGQEAVVAATGPLAKHVEDLDVMVKAVLNSNPWETAHDVVPIPYREATLPKKLRIGYYLDDGKYPTTPACERAVMMAVEALKAAGHDVFPYHEPAIKGASDLYSKLAGMDKSRPKHEALLPHEKMTIENTNMAFLHKLPTWVAWIVCKVLSGILGEKGYSEVVWDFITADTNTMFKLVSEREDKEKKSFEAWSNAIDENGATMDFVICPISPMPSFEHHTFVEVGVAYGNNFLYNLIGNTVGVIPVSRVNREIDGIEDLSSWLKSKVSEDYSEKFFLQKLIYSQYDAHEMHGLPVAIQVVGRKFEEEKVAKGMELIDKILKEYDQPNKYTTYSQYKKENLN